MKHFFISYNKADRAWAEWIAWQLEQAGYTTIIQAWDFRPGSNFVLEMDKGATEAERMIAVLSLDYLSALYTRPEWASAFTQDPSGEKRTLVPVCVGACTPEGLLKAIVYIDLVGKNEVQAREALLSGVKRERFKPSTAPHFPGAPKAGPATVRFPGTLPDIWNVPHLRNPNFTGRDELLKNLRAALTSGRTAAVTQSIAGLGGVGKTQVVVEYAYRHAADYSLVWWVHAEEPATLAGEYADLAQQIGLPEKVAAGRPSIVAAVRSWLEHSSGWMLIFDNANNAAECRDYVPRGTSGHVIVTSRDPLWSGVADPLHIGVMSRPESVAFLERRTGQRDSAADKLCETLGDLPLALDQAAAYIEASGISVADYLRNFDKYARELLNRPPSTDYPNTVVSTWRLAFERIERETPTALDLLYLVAYLAPDDIDRNLIANGTEYLPPRLAESAANPVKFDSIIVALRRYSLIDVRDGAFAIHRLVQAVIRDQLAERNDEGAWAEVAVRLVNAAFSFKDDRVETWRASARLLSHALAASGHSERLTVGLESAGWLLSQIGGYLDSRAQFTESEQVLRRALTIDEKVYGPDHPMVATDANNVGQSLKAQRDLEGALRYAQRALEIGEKVFGPDHPKVAVYNNNLGQILKDQGDLTGAEHYTRRALAMFERFHGPSHPTVAAAANNIGVILKARGNLEEALRHTQRALGIDEAFYGPDHPNVASYANNVGIILQAQGDLEGALRYAQQALAITERVFGPEHPNVAVITNNVGSILKAQGNLEGALKCAERALTIDEKFYGPDHHTTVTNAMLVGEFFAMNVDQVIKVRGDLEGSLDCINRALRVLKRVLEREDPKRSWLPPA